MHRNRLKLILTAWLACAVISRPGNAQESGVQEIGGKEHDVHDIRIIPAEFTLHGIESQQRLSVVALSGDRVAAAFDETELQIESSDPTVAQIEDGVVRPVGNGNATIVARSADGREATAVVQVTNAEQEHLWSFRNEVQSVFSRIGCNSGACHGALAGKGGFRLSLHGYNPEGDYLTITREARGRRVELADPGKSLILTKPSGALPHKGGLKLDPKSTDYRVLAEWIAAGANGPRNDDPRLVRISVMPESALLRPGDHSRVLVNAHYDDGRTVDVTHWSKFTRHR